MCPNRWTGPGCELSCGSDLYFRPRPVQRPDVRALPRHLALPYFRRGFVSSGEYGLRASVLDGFSPAIQSLASRIATTRGPRNGVSRTTRHAIGTIGPSATKQTRRYSFRLGGSPTALRGIALRVAARPLESACVELTISCPYFDLGAPNSTLPAQARDARADIPGIRCNQDFAYLCITVAKLHPLKNKDVFHKGLRSGPRIWNSMRKFDNNGQHRRSKTAWRKRTPPRPKIQ